jgi:tetratricopeptide (TPR) repeat protein
MQTLIVGIGALGGTIAARAISAGLPVRLAARNTDSAAALRRSGLRVTGIGGEVRADAIDGDQQRALSSFVKVAPPEPAVTKRREIWKIAVAAAVAAGIVAGGPSLRSQSQKAQLTEKDTVVLADFANSTGDTVFDDTLKQALSVALNQSPFLNVLPDNKVGAMLKLMTRPSDAKLTPELARELCQRAGSKAYIAGSIASMGSEYVLGLKAVNCQSGDLLAQEQVMAAGKAEVLDAVGEAAAKLRGELGESLVTVQKFDVPLAEATTPSLEALKAYTLGQAAGREKGPAAALPHNQRAIQLDPNFASGYEAVGANYFSLSELGRASEYFNKAFELREHASEREKLAITATYYQIVTGELEKAEQTYQEWVESYPRDYRAHLRLGNVYLQRGQYEKAEEAYRASLRLTTDSITPYGNLADALLALQRFDEARQIIQQAHSRKLDDFVARSALYALAFLRVDSPAMAEEQRWFAGQPEVEYFGLSLASDSEAYAGHLLKARELTRRSVQSAIHADSKEAGAIWQENAALREAAFGNMAQAKQSAEEGVKLAPASQSVAVEAALAFAMAGDGARAESMAQDLNKRFPLDTQVQALWLPAIRAQLALDRKKPADALNAMQASSGPIEFGTILFVANLSCLYPTYVRGEAYLEAGEGGAAAAEFQKIRDHGGLVWNCWTGALAHLGVARANALQARTAKGADGDSARVRALAAYKDFLDLWKDADPDVSILKQAKAEYQFLFAARPPSASRASWLLVEIGATALE